MIIKEIDTKQIYFPVFKVSLVQTVTAGIPFQKKDKGC